MRIQVGSIWKELSLVKISKGDRTLWNWLWAVLSLNTEAFDPAVLEQYRNDPQYLVEVHGFSGWISITDEHKDSVDDHHAIYLQTFGFARTENAHPAIAVYLRYLQQLTPEHQQLWHSKRIEKKTQLNRIYQLQTYGHWATHISVPDAILEELKEINVLCELIGKPELFKSVFEDNERPRIFGVLLRPTQHEYERAVQILDKVLSENLNIDFFSPEISRQYVENGEKKNKGSIRMLEEWLDHCYHGQNQKSYGRNIFEPFRNVRTLRSKPSHTLTEDVYDASYYDKFREVLEGVYNALSTFRMILSKHPYAQSYSAPDLLERGMISHTW